MRRILAITLFVALALTGCSGSSALDRIKVGGTAEAPTLTVPKNFSVDKTVTKVVKPGKGATLQTGDTAKVDFAAYNGRTGKQFDNSFGSAGALTVKLSKAKTPLPGLLKALKGQQVGARLIVAIPPIDGFQAERPEIGLLKSDTMVFYLRVTSKVPQMASGKKVLLPADVPSVRMEGGHPSGFAKTPSTPASVTTASAHVVIKGSGPAVPKGGTVVAHYLGQVFPEGAVFDSSWARGAPATFPLNGVIKCWQNLLPGVPIGSRVVLECPAADAYGDAPQPGSKIKPGDDLLFVVDILDAQ